MKNSSVCIVGYFGYGNFGDDLMLVNLTEFLLSKDIKVRVLTKNRLNELSNKVEQINISNNTGFLDYHRHFSNFDTVIWGGGTCLYSTNKNLRGLIGLLKRVLVAKYLKINFIFLGIGIEKPKNLFYEILYKLILMNSKHLLCRDIESVKLANKLNIKASLSHDLSILSVGDHRKSITEANYIVFAVAGYENVYPYINDIAQYLKSISNYFGKKILLISLHDGLDDECNLKLYEMLRGTVSVKFYSNIDVNEKVEIIKNSYFVISLRLHGIILSDLLGLPVFGISYQDKVKQYLEKEDLYNHKRYFELTENFDVNSTINSVVEQRKSQQLLIRLKAQKEGLETMLASILDKKNL